MGHQVVAIVILALEMVKQWVSQLCRKCSIDEVVSSNGGFGPSNGDSDYSKGS